MREWLAVDECLDGVKHRVEGGDGTACQREDMAVGRNMYSAVVLELHEFLQKARHWSMSKCACGHGS